MQRLHLNKKSRKENNMQKCKKIIAFITFIAIVFVLFSAALYIASNTDHLCTGEHCTICQRLQLCRDTFKTAAGAAAATFTAAVLLFALRAAAVFAAKLKKCFTLVSFKIKLTD